MSASPVVRLRTASVLEELREVAMPAAPTGGQLIVTEFDFDERDYEEMSKLIRADGYIVLDHPTGLEVFW